MTLLDRLLENAVDIDASQAHNAVGHLLAADEFITHAWMVGMRDKLVFTNKRLISCDTQGAVFGKKKDIVSYPWENVFYWSITSAGTLDFDTELTISAKTMGLPLAVSSPAAKPPPVTNASPTSVYGATEFSSVQKTELVDPMQIPRGPLVIKFSKDTDVHAVARAISSFVL